MVGDSAELADEGGELMQKIKAIVKRPDEMYGHMTWISNSLKNLQNTVDGYIETATVSSDMVIICNEEGIIKGLPLNCELCGHQFFGTIIACGVDGDEFSDIPMTFDEWKRFFFGGGLT